MRRFSAAIAAAVVFFLAFGLTGCGNSNNTTAATPAKIQLNPATTSLAFGSVQQLSASVLDEEDALIASATVTFTSSDPAVTLSTAGVSLGTWFTTACAGKWSDSQIVCQPATTPHVVEITATSGSVSAKTTVYVHSKVDRVLVTPASVNCQSQAATQQFTAKVFSGNQDVSSAVGPVQWGTPFGQDVVSVDSDGIATAGQPGKSSVFASVSGVTSLPAGFTTCPVKTVRVHLPDSTDTSFTVAGASSQQLTADVFDINGDKINSPSLSWVSSEPKALSAGVGVITGVAGYGTITATCQPPLCNRGLEPAYGNTVLGRATGDLTSRVYAAGTDSTSLVPINPADNTAGTAITLPAKPNSILFSPDGNILYLGSNDGLLTVSILAGTFTQNTSRPGKVLAVSLDGRVLVAGSDKVTFISPSLTEELAIAGATAAAFSPQNRAYIIAGNKLYIHTPGNASVGVLPPSINLSGTGISAGFLATGAVGFATQSNNFLTALANCNSSVLPGVATSAPLSLMGALPNGSGMLAVSSSGIDRISVNPAPPEPLVGCPPSTNFTVDSNAFGASLTPRQLIILPDGSKAYATSDQGKLQVYDVTADTLTTVTLNGGASAFTGGATLDASTLWLGASDSKVHRINTATGEDTNQITVDFVPDLVAVK